MSHTSLSSGDAATRRSQMKVLGTRVELDLRDQRVDTFSSRTTIDFSSRGADTFVDFQGRELRSATLNGVALEVTDWQAGRIPLANLQPRNTLVVDGVMAYSSDGEGLHRHVDPEDGLTYLYAMSFLDAAPRWFACFDQPDLKSTYTFDIAAPPEWTVIGNGPAATTGPGRWRISPPKPLSTYFVTLVAGPYASVLTEHDGIRLGFHVRASLRSQLEAEVADLIEVTEACFDYYHRTFGVRYPFGEYHQAFVPDFNAGAMENPGCVTFRDQLIFRGRATRTERAGRASVIAHEMAHQWFGDLVTMAWWDDLWLNESFAEYMAHRTCEAATRYQLWTDFGIIRKDWGSTADQSPSTHPVAGNGAPDGASALQDFDGISYAKGASVLQQLAAYVGDEVFLRGLRIYFDRFAFGNATFADLITAWTEAGAVDLSIWAAAWLRTTGMDTLDVTGRPPRIEVTVTPPAGQAPSERRHVVRIGAINAQGSLVESPFVTVGGSPQGVDVPAGSVLVVPDAGDETWAKIRFGPDGWADLAEVFPAVRDEPVQVVVHNAIRDAAREASLDPRHGLDLVLAAVPGTAADVIVTYTMAFALDQLAGAYCPPAERAGRRDRVHAVARTVLDTADPGSDRQLVGFRLSVRSAADAALLRRWSEGTDLPAGLELDPELRWSVVTRLVALTGDEALIEAALTADPSAQARVHAARARAAIPTAAAKARAWDLLMQPSTVSAYEIYATGAGFFVPEQDELTAPYSAAFFDEIGATADFRSGWALATTSDRAYPWTAVSPGTLERAERLLTTELAPPVRRSITDNTDLLRRALRSLERFGSDPLEP